MNVYLLAAVIASIYLFTKIIELNFVEEENKKPIKILVCDSLIVYFSVVAGYFIYNQVIPPLEDVDIPPEIFTDAPDF
jgi:hypothetical protein